MGRPALEDTPDCLLQLDGVHSLVLMDQQKVHEISGPCGTSRLVRPRVSVQLFRDLPLRRHQQDVDRFESQVGQQPRPPSRLSVPRIERRVTDIHLQWLEWASGEGALELVPNGETDTRFAKLFRANDEEAEMIANVLNGRPLQIRTGRLGAVRVVCVQVDRNARPLSEWSQARSRP
jgi:hypothetical protein